MNHRTKFPEANETETETFFKEIDLKMFPLERYNSGQPVVAVTPARPPPTLAYRSKVSLSGFPQCDLSFITSLCAVDVEGEGASLHR